MAYCFPFLIVTIQNTRAQKALTVGADCLSVALFNILTTSVVTYTISFCVCPRQNLLNPALYMYFMCSESMVIY